MSHPATVDNHHSDGLSLRYAYRPSTEAQLESLTAEHTCLSCGDKGQFVTGDLGPKKQMASLIYYRGAMKCQCGFMNFAYVIINDLPEEKKNQAMPSRVSIDKEINEGNIPDYRMEEFLQMSAACAHNEDFDEAEAYIKRCLEIDPDNQAALYNLGWLCTKREALQDAVQAYKKVESISDNFPSASLNLGYIYQEAGDYQNAIKSYRKFLNRYPNHMDARNRLTQCDKKLAG
ncbi:tetratricopeptide repeat protein [Pleionea sediminis]|uniref:tetratricopeptide repeat protein n=1 Tax=Pleionea sediminis TaxID=2569479 RepID=UPI0011849C8A|nr:tetratricopeptide repeat protein [Pleionea sediminis]